MCAVSQHCTFHAELCKQKATYIIIQFSTPMGSFVRSRYASKICLGMINSGNILRVRFRYISACVCVCVCAVGCIFTEMKPADLIRTISVSIMYDSLVNSGHPIPLRPSPCLIGS